MVKRSGWMVAKLRAVGADEKPAPRKRDLTLSEAIAEGDRRAVLVANRNIVVKALEKENATAASVAALTKRLQEIMNDIDAFDAAAKKEVGEAGGSSDDVGDGAFDSEAV
jgi:hypothetical protein